MEDLPGLLSELRILNLGQVVENVKADVHGGAQNVRCIAELFGLVSHSLGKLEVLADSVKIEVMQLNTFGNFMNHRDSVAELLKALQYYEVTLSWQRKANKNIIAEIKRLLIEKGL